MSTDMSIVDPACDLGQLSRDIAKDYVEYRDGERALEVSEKKTEGLRERQRQRRIELGRKLIAARAMIKHGGWLPFLEKQGIAERTAQAWISECKDLDKCAPSADSSKPLNRRERVEMHKAKSPRYRDEKPDPPEGPSVDVERPGPSLRIVPDDEPAATASWERDAGREYVALEKKIAAHHGSWSEWSRDDITRKLQGLIDRIAGAT